MFFIQEYKDGMISMTGAGNILLMVQFFVQILNLMVPFYSLKNGFEQLFLKVLFLHEEEEDCLKTLYED